MPNFRLSVPLQMSDFSRRISLKSDISSLPQNTKPLSAHVPHMRRGALSCCKTRCNYGDIFPALISFTSRSAW
jgi:hypothetical protein